MANRGERSEAHAGPGRAPANEGQKGGAKENAGKAGKDKGAAGEKGGREREARSQRESSERAKAEREQRAAKERRENDSRREAGRAAGSSRRELTGGQTAPGDRRGAAATQRDTKRSATETRREKLRTAAPEKTAAGQRAQPGANTDRNAKAKEQTRKTEEFAKAFLANRKDGAKIEKLMGELAKIGLEVRVGTDGRFPDKVAVFTRDRASGREVLTVASGRNGKIETESATRDGPKAGGSKSNEPHNPDLPIPAGDLDIANASIPNERWVPAQPEKAAAKPQGPAGPSNRNVPSQADRPERANRADRAAPPRRPERPPRTSGLPTTVPTGFFTAWPVPGHYGLNVADEPGEGQPHFHAHRDGGRLHQGIDIAASPGSVIVAPADGWVVSTTPGAGYGNQIILGHRGRIFTQFAHLSRVLVRSGRVWAGQPIGIVGTPGANPGDNARFGAHTHMELRLGSPDAGTRTADPLQHLPMPENPAPRHNPPIAPAPTPQR